VREARAGLAAAQVQQHGVAILALGDRLNNAGRFSIVSKGDRNRAVRAALDNLTRKLRRLASEAKSAEKL